MEGGQCRSYSSSLSVTFLSEGNPPFLSKRLPREMGCLQADSEAPEVRHDNLGHLSGLEPKRLSPSPQRPLGGTLALSLLLVCGPTSASRAWPLSAPTRLVMGPSSSAKVRPVSPSSCPAWWRAQSRGRGLSVRLPTFLGGPFRATTFPVQWVSLSLGGVIGPKLDPGWSPPKETVEVVPALPEVFTCLSASPHRHLVGYEPLELVEADHRLAPPLRGVGGLKMDSGQSTPLRPVDEIFSLPEVSTGLSASGLSACPGRLLFDCDSLESVVADSGQSTPLRPVDQVFSLPEVSTGLSASGLSACPIRLLFDCDSLESVVADSPVPEVSSDRSASPLRLLVGSPLEDSEADHVELGPLDKLTVIPSLGGLGLVPLDNYGSVASPTDDQVRHFSENADEVLLSHDTLPPCLPLVTSAPLRSSLRIQKKQTDSTLCRAMRRKARLLEGAPSGLGTKDRKLNRQRIKSKSLLCGVKLSDAEASELCNFLRMEA